jgi:hypothetical protein
MSITILPRRQRAHPTMQPVHARAQVSSVKTKTKHRLLYARVRVPNTALACREYREGATLLRDLGMPMAARMLEATADALQSTVTPADDDTVVADVPPLPPVEPK